MRFRGTLAQDALDVFLDVTQSFTRLATQKDSICVCTVTRESFSIAIKSSSDELQSFARLQTNRVFQEVTVESRADNNIGFSCDIRHLHQALQSGRDAGPVMLRLLKRDGGSFFCLRTRAVDIDIVQSVPIQLMSMREVEHYDEPSVPSPEVVLELPPLKSMRSVIDKLKAMYSSIVVEASKKGTLVYRIESSAVTLQALFAHLKPRDDLVYEDENGSTPTSSRQNKSYRVSVDGKVLSKAMAVEGGFSESVLCCIAEDKAMVLHAVLLDGFGSFTCYLPVLTPDDS